MLCCCCLTHCYARCNALGHPLHKKRYNSTTKCLCLHYVLGWCLPGYLQTNHSLYARLRKAQLQSANASWEIESRNREGASVRAAPTNNLFILGKPRLEITSTDHGCASGGWKFRQKSKGCNASLVTYLNHSFRNILWLYSC